MAVAFKRYAGESLGADRLVVARNGAVLSNDYGVTDRLAYACLAESAIAVRKEHSSVIETIDLIDARLNGKTVVCDSLADVIAFAEQSRQACITAAV